MSTAAVGINSVEDLERLSRPQIQVYSGGLEPETVEMCGHYYHFPARGVAYIGDQFTYPIEDTASGRRADFSTRILSETAVNIAKAIVHPSCRGEKGFVILIGDGRDNERKQQANARYMAWREEKARATQTEWLAKVQKITEAPGAVAPSPNREVRADMEFLRQYTAGKFDRKAFVCKLDGWEADSREDVLAYIRDQYPTADAEANVQQVRSDDMVPAEGPAEAKRQSEDGAAMLALAEEAGLTLSVGDRKGLSFGDADVMADVESRVEAVGKAKSKGKGGSK